MENFLVKPRGFSVVDPESDVWANPEGLDGRKVDSEDGGRWVLVAHYVGFSSAIIIVSNEPPKH